MDLAKANSPPVKKADKVEWWTNTSALSLKSFQKTLNDDVTFIHFSRYFFKLLWSAQIESKVSQMQWNLNGTICLRAQVKMFCVALRVTRVAQKKLKTKKPFLEERTHCK